MKQQFKDPQSQNLILSEHLPDHDVHSERYVYLHCNFGMMFFAELEPAILTIVGVNSAKIEKPFRITLALAKAFDQPKLVAAVCNVILHHVNKNLSSRVEPTPMDAEARSVYMGQENALHEQVKKQFEGPLAAVASATGREVRWQDVVSSLPNLSAMIERAKPFPAGGPRPTATQRQARQIVGDGREEFVMGRGTGRTTAWVDEWRTLTDSQLTNMRDRLFSASAVAEATAVSRDKPFGARVHLHDGFLAGAKWAQEWYTKVLAEKEAADKLHSNVTSEQYVARGGTAGDNPFISRNVINDRRGLYVGFDMATGSTNDHLYAQGFTIREQPPVTAPVEPTKIGEKVAIKPDFAGQENYCDPSYCEVNDGTPYDWEKFLSEKRTEEQWLEAKVVACGWANCGCGQQSDRIPRSLTGAPTDEKLRQLGYTFTEHICVRKRKKALAIYREIVERSNEIIAELGAAKLATQQEAASGDVVAVDFVDSTIQPVAWRTWEEELQDAINNPGHTQFYNLISKSGDWSTCYVGQLGPGHEVSSEYSNRPEDEELRDLGLQFTRLVQSNQEALDLIPRIKVAHERAVERYKAKQNPLYVADKWLGDRCINNGPEDVVLNAAGQHYELWKELHETKVNGCNPQSEGRTERTTVAPEPVIDDGGGKWNPVHVGKRDDGKFHYNGISQSLPPDSCDCAACHFLRSVNQ